MDALNSIANSLLRAYFAAFAWAPPIVSLTVFSAAAGAALLWVFQKTSNQTKIRAAKRLAQAHLLELRIFRDEPSVMWQAQKSLFAANLRYTGLMLVPALWMALPFAVMIVHLDAFYGRLPMAVGTGGILTMRLRSPFDPQAAAPALVTPAGVTAETPAVRVLAEQEVSWRIRSQAPVSDDLRITLGGGSITKRIEAGGDQRFVPGRRVSSLFDAVWHPDESRIQSPDVEWIEMQYPEARIRVLGFGMHWLVWFTIVSMVSALFLRKTFRVVL